MGRDQTVIEALYGDTVRIADGVSCENIFLSVCENHIRCDVFVTTDQARQIAVELLKRADKTEKRKR